MDDFLKMKNHIEKQNVNLLVRATARFANTPHEHQTFMLVDPANNVLEFKCYLRPEFSY